MVDEPAKYPGCSGSRCFRDVESDLKAQIAANNKGVGLINMLIQEYGALPRSPGSLAVAKGSLAGIATVQKYMLHIRDNAELAVRNLLKEVASRIEGNELSAIDYLDDGTPIALKVTINAQDGSAVFDFDGTGPEMIGNLNAPMSVCYSAIIYCLRAMVDQDIPLNQGCLVPIDVKLPECSVLSPSSTAAVVGGNVCTSQRVVDVTLRAFEACGASQGDCNNLTFGQGGTDVEGKQIPGFGYYETIAGGSGAGPSWDGTSGVHTHMTNTRITDPETLERRYPVILREFSLRKGSGGDGEHIGGDGVVRDIEFLEPIRCSILSERRVHRPYGLKGGLPGESGRNIWVKQRRESDGDVLEGDENAARVINLGGKATVQMGKHDRIIINTPGGGGWGAPKEGAGRREHVKSHAVHSKGDPRGAAAERTTTMHEAQ